MHSLSFGQNDKQSYQMDLCGNLKFVTVKSITVYVIILKDISMATAISGMLSISTSMVCPLFHLAF